MTFTLSKELLVACRRQIYEEKDMETECPFLEGVIDPAYGETEKTWNFSRHRIWKRHSGRETSVHLV